MFKIYQKYLQSQLFLVEYLYMPLEKHKHFFHKNKVVAKHHVETSWEWTRRHLETITWASLSLGVIIFGLLLIRIATLKVPTLDNFADRNVASSTKIYDKTGTVVLYDVHANIKRTVVTGDQIPQTMKNAVIAIEDRNFYNHGGIEPKAILRALLSQIIPGFGSSQGGSTITQQLIKNTLLTQEKKYFS
jgi:membrane peptidoglycan carboxypeptidase